jgi:hypothetical protein
VDGRHGPRRAFRKTGGSATFPSSCRTQACESDAKYNASRCAPLFHRHRASPAVEMFSARAKQACSPFGLAKREPFGRVGLEMRETTLLPSNSAIGSPQQQWRWPCPAHHHVEMSLAVRPGARQSSPSLSHWVTAQRPSDKATRRVRRQGRSLGCLLHCANQHARH